MIVRIARAKVGHRQAPFQQTAHFVWAVLFVHPAERTFSGQRLKELELAYAELKWLVAEQLRVIGRAEGVLSEKMSSPAGRRAAMERRPWSVQRDGVDEGGLVAGGGAGEGEGVRAGGRNRE
jgi:hypothetical protein